MHFLTRASGILLLSLFFQRCLLAQEPAKTSNTAKSQAPAWRLHPVSSLQKLTAKSKGQLEPFSVQPVQMVAARGEWESFQIVVSAGAKPLQVTKIQATNLASHLAHIIPASNIELYWENYVYVDKPSGNRRLEKLWWPDALIPLSLQPTKTIAPHTSEVLWVAVQVPADSEPGEYYGAVDFESNLGPRTLAVSLEVAKTRLPPPSMRANVAVYYDILRDWHAKNAQPISDAEFPAFKKRYYDFLLRYHINAYDLPVEWNSPEAVSYLQNTKVLSVRLPPLDSPRFNDAVAALRQTNTLHKAYYYWIDEPPPQRYTEVLSTTKELHEIDPRLKHLVTVHPNQSLQNAVDIWTPNIGDYFGLGYIDFAKLAQERKKGRETWWYTMVEPKHPYPTWLLDDEASAVRIYGWLMARYGISGFVYSMAHGWGPKPLENLQSFAGTNGDGTLLYPSEIVGGNGPMPSIRLMLLRDAIEDFELLKAADAKLRTEILEKGMFQVAASHIIKGESANAYEMQIAQKTLENSIDTLRGKMLGIRPTIANVVDASSVSDQRANKAAIDQLAEARIIEKLPSLFWQIPYSVPGVDGQFSAHEWNSVQTRVPFTFDPLATDLNKSSPTSLFVSHDASNLYVAIRARNSAKALSGEWVAVELSPQNAQEKWRFVVTAKGNMVVEKHTREGHFRIENVQWKGATKQFHGYYDVEIKIPLNIIGNAKQFRFNAIRRVWDDKLQMNYLVRAVENAGDPRLMPLVSLAPVKVLSPTIKPRTSR
jgi:hypothetical protein